MKIKSLTVFIEGSDLVENWFLDRRTNQLTPELNDSMKIFYEENVVHLRVAQPIIGALVSAVENTPPTFAFFGDMVEVRYNDALKQANISE